MSLWNIDPLALTNLVWNAISPSISNTSWVTLNETLNGRLQIGEPIARPCYTHTANDVTTFADEVACSHVQSQYGNQAWLIEQFGSFINTQWSTCQVNEDQCLLDWMNPSNADAFSPPRSCAQGSVPPLYVRIESAADVQAVFAFAKSEKVDLVIKNTGHDYLGRSSGPGTLALWTVGLKDLSLNRNFIPTGCPANTAPVAGIKIGAGVTNGMVSDFAVANKITVPGGADRTVGAVGGYLQGGGHSGVSNVFGLALDRALEFEVVTPNGHHLIANRCMNTDLFFALRGGGGGTFGVVLSATVLALPQQTFQSFFLTYASIPENTEAVLRYFIENGVALSSKAWGGYVIPRAFPEVILTNPLVTAAEAAEEGKALKAFVATLVNGTFEQSTQSSYSEWFDTFLLGKGVPVGVPYAMTSRLIPTANFETKESRDLLFEKMLTSINYSDLPIIGVVSPHYFGKGDGLTSISEAWRTSVWHYFSSKFWNFDTSLADRHAISTAHSAAIQGLRDITPDSGVYMNENDVNEPDYTKAFWGSNYDRLLSIKHKYDPDGLLDCWKCVGWKGADQNRFKCYI
ncbi:FAD-binding domain-containing protein [Mycena floridula]|nr:FAD-binding domain-containing protein [Mycena floridula]